MQITRYIDACPYKAPLHHGVDSRLLQGRDVSDAQAMWVGLSVYEAGGGAEMAASETEKIYFLIDGELVVTLADGTDHRLSKWDSCLFAPLEARRVRNEGARPARLVVISATR